jgi:hypothetical protein
MSNGATNTEEKGTGPSPIKESLSIVAAILLPIGLAMYALIYLAHARFYNALGIDAAEVGFSYSNALIQGSGFIATFVLATIVGYPFVLIIVLMVRHPFGRGTKGHSWRVGNFTNSLTSWLNSQRQLLVFTLVVTIALLTIFLVVREISTNTRAVNAVQTGHPLIIPRSILGIPTILVRADPVEIVSIGKPEDVRNVALLHDDKLLYLGQTNSYAVLYDSKAQQSVRLPLSVSIIRVTHCRHREDAPVCREAITVW